MTTTITNQEVNQYFENLVLIGTFGIYENRACTGFSVRVSEEESESFENRNGVFISISELGNASIMIMRAPDNNEVVGVDEIEKLKIGFEKSQLNLEEAEERAKEIRQENESFLTMMGGNSSPNTGVTLKAPEKFDIEE